MGAEAVLARQRRARHRLGGIEHVDKLDAVDERLVPQRLLGDRALGGAAAKALLLLKQFIDWWEAWDDRCGFDKWWDDIAGNTINWGVDFAGLGKCVDRATDYLKKNTEQSRKELEDSARSFGDMVDDNRQGLGL